MNIAELRAEVETIVVVMMENRSFDHVLGYLRHPEHGHRLDVDGIADLSDPNYLNPNGDAVGIPPFFTRDAPLPSDLPHERSDVEKQLAFANITGSFLMNGFVKAFEEAFHTSLNRSPPMGLLTAPDLPTTSVLADRYTVCDHWFACVPTSTAPNRLMSMCGATDIADTGTLVPNQPTVYDWLSDHDVRWRVYSAGLPFFALMPRLAPLIITHHFRRFEELQRDLERDPPSERPQVIFIEPDYYDSPVHFRPPCDNHAPLAMGPGEAFLAEVYRTLTSHPDSWAKTVFVLTYDEHGGFFDHVEPRRIHYRNPNGVAFDSTGPRVPAIVAGPFAPRGVSKAVLDNTSVLQLLAERFGHAGEAYSSQVKDRANQGIASVSAVLSTGADNAAVAAIQARPQPPAPASDVVGNPALRTAFANATRNLVGQHGAQVLAKYPELGRKG